MAELCDALPDATQAGATADVLTAVWTGDREDLLSTGHPKEDRLALWCSKLRHTVIEVAAAMHLKAAVILLPMCKNSPPESLYALAQPLRHRMGWGSTIFLLHNLNHGGLMATSHWCLIAAEQTVLREWETPKSHSDGPQEGTQAMDYHTPEGASFLLLLQFNVKQE